MDTVYLLIGIGLVVAIAISIVGIKRLQLG